MIVVKFICAILFHFKFKSEIGNGLKMMKYAALHQDEFENAGMAFIMGLSNMVVIYIVEVILLWNLSSMTDGTYQIIFDFIALGVIAEFDDHFLEIYRYTRLSHLITSIEITFTQMR